MALTQVNTDGVKDDAVTLAKQAAGTDGQIITYDASGNPVAVGPGTDGQVLTSTGAGSPPAFETLPASNNYTHPNHSGEVTSTADGAQVIASNVVDEDNLKVSNSPTNGYFLSAQSGNTGGLTWAAAGGKINAYQVTKLETDGYVSNPGYTQTEIPQTEVSYTPTTAASFLVVRCHTAIDCKPHNMDNGGEEFYPRAGMVMKEINGSATTFSSNTLQRLNLYSHGEHRPSDTEGVRSSKPCSFVGRISVNGESWSSGAIKFCVTIESGWNYPLYVQVNDWSSTVWEITEYTE